MEEPIIDPNYEFEAPQFVNFSSVLDDEDDYADAWFDNRPDDEGGIQIPIDADEAELHKDCSDSQRSKRKNVIIDVMLSEQQQPIVSKNESKPTAISTQITANTVEATNMNEEGKIQEEIKAESVSEEVKCETEPDQKAVCDEVSVAQNRTESNLTETEVNEPLEVEKHNIQEVQSEEKPVQETSSDEHVITTEENAIVNVLENNSNDVETAESDAESQKEGQTNNSESSYTTEEEGQKDQSSQLEKRVTRALKRRNRSLNLSGSSDVPNKKKKPSRSSSGSTQSRRSRSRSNPPPITVPVTPQCLKRQKTNKPSIIKLKTTEEMEMECIAKLRKQTKHHIKANESSMKKAILCPAVNAVRASGTSLTRPHEFHFQTDKRVKQHPMATRADQQQHNLNGEDCEKEFWNSLRQHPPSPSWKNRTATVPKPFNLSDGGQKKRKHSAMDKDTTETDSYETMAYQVYKFQTTTPPRFRTRKANDLGFKNETESGQENAASVPKPVTLPKTPNLSTKTRSRPMAEGVLSKEEKEAKELEEMKNYKFKAKPFDRRIIECDGMYGVKKPEETIAATKPKPFVFESDERLETRKEKEPEENEEEHAPNFKAMPQPNFEKVFRPQLKHARTEPKPFSFEEKDKERWQKKEEKIHDVYKEEERLREFKAQPLPSDSPDPLPAVSSKCCTSFKPFALNTDNRGAKKAEKWIQKVKSELEEGRTKATFKAKPCKVVHDAPFVPQKSKKPLTEVNEFALNTNHRAERREELEVSKKEREQIDEELRREREAQREREEQEAIALLRKQLVHKAQPIHKYKNVKVKPSEKPLTEAHSPAWSEMKRRRIDHR